MERVSDELISASIDAYYYDRWSTIVSENPKLDMNDRFLVFIWDAYFHKQSMVIRRQVKVDERSISLVRLLEDIAKNAPVLTRELYMWEMMGYWPTPKEQREGDRHNSKEFDRFAGKGMSHVSPARIGRDIKRLECSARRFEYYSDKWIAHSDRKRRWPKLSFTELARAIKLFEKTAHRYWPLVWRGPHTYDIPFLAGDDWEEVLEFPWKIKSN